MILGGDIMSEKDLNLKEFLEEIGWSKSKFYDNIYRICSKEAYDIEIGKFKKAGRDKEDYTTDDRHFCFKKEWYEIAYVLFSLYADNPFFRKNSNSESVTFKEILEYYKNSVMIVEEELPDYYRKQTMLHPVYLSTLTEIKMMENISNKLSMLLTLGSKMPIEIRTNMWKTLNNVIDITLIDSYIYGLNLKEALDVEKGDLYRNQLFGEVEHTSLDKFIAHTLKQEMDEDFVKEREELNKKYAEEQEMLDKLYIKVSGDSEEFVKMVKEKFIELNLQEKLEEAQEVKEKMIIDNYRKKAIETGEFDTSIENSIDKIIKELEKKGDPSNKETIEKLEKVKAIVTKDLEDYKVNSATEKFLSELNYKIMKRRD